MRRWLTSAQQEDKRDDECNTVFYGSLDFYYTTGDIAFAIIEFHICEDKTSLAKCDRARLLQKEI